MLPQLHRGLPGEMQMGQWLRKCFLKSEAPHKQESSFKLKANQQETQPFPANSPPRVSFNPHSASSWERGAQLQKGTPDSTECQPVLGTVRKLKMCQTRCCLSDAEDVGSEAEGKRKYPKPSWQGRGGRVHRRLQSEQLTRQALGPGTQLLLRGCCLNSSLPQHQALQLPLSMSHKHSPPLFSLVPACRLLPG